MVKKRAVLSGQGKAMFFSDEKKAKTEDKKATSPKAPAKKASSSANPDLVNKIKLLKDLVGEFKKLTDSESFKSIRLKDLDGFKA